MNQDQRDALEVMFAASIAAVLGLVSLVVLAAVWNLEVPEPPTGTCRDAESLQEIECGKYDDN